MCQHRDQVQVTELNVDPDRYQIIAIYPISHMRLSLHDLQREWSGSTIQTRECRQVVNP